MSKKWSSGKKSCLLQKDKGILRTSQKDNVYKKKSCDIDRMTKIMYCMMTKSGLLLILKRQKSGILVIAEKTRKSGLLVHGDDLKKWSTG